MSDPAPLRSLDGRVAGFITRLLAYLTDVLTLVVIIGAGAWLFSLVDQFIQDLIPSANPASVAAIFALSVPLIITFYFVMFWSLTGRTLGKMVMGLRIIGPNGYPPTVGKSFLRLIGYGVSMLAFWMGYLWILVDNDRQAWHDHMATTWVIYDFERRTPGESYQMATARDQETGT